MGFDNSFLNVAGATAPKGSGVADIGGVVAGLITDYAFASSIKSDQKKFEKEIKKLDAKKQQELLAKIQEAQTEIERQKLVYQYVDKQKIDAIKSEGKKRRTIMYVGLGLGLIAYTLIFLKLKKR
jgi:mannitol-specific phosphotransferase system IIBC component